MIQINYNQKIKFLVLLIYKTRNVQIENELKKLKAFDIGYFIDRNYFNEDGA